MVAHDFQGKFLKVGYSRRNDPDNKSRRVVFGRKGIGKLALLSVSKKIIIVSKKGKDATTVGGIIDNAKLDKQIKNDGEYSLELIEGNEQNGFSLHTTGTSITFIDIKLTMNNPDTIRRYMAVLFNFTFRFPNEEFKIFVNAQQVSINDLEQLNKNTQYCWVYDDDKTKPRRYQKKIYEFRKQ